MNLTIKPHKDACILAAFAMAAGVTLEYLIEKIGHDGTEVIDSEVVGFHIQEIIGPLVTAGMAFTPIESGPVAVRR